MSTILPFVPRAELTATQNLNLFIEHAKNKKHILKKHNIEWNSQFWDFSVNLKFRGSDRSYKINYKQLDTSKNNSNELFVESCKAITIHAFETAKTNAYNWFQVLLFIEKAFLESGITPNITALDHQILDLAATKISDHCGGVRYLSALEKIAELVIKNTMCSNFVQWQVPFDKPRNNDRSINVNRNYKSEVSSKIPHLKCILDLANVFQEPKSDSDIIVTSWFALAMFAPSRVSEIVALPVKCTTEMDGFFGISWQPSKNGQALTKFEAGNEWKEVATEAIQRLKVLGESARKAARWYRNNPEDLYMPEHLEFLRGEPLTKKEILEIIGSDFMHEATYSRYFKSHPKQTSDPARIGDLTRAGLYEFDSVEKWVLKQLPKSFPIADRKLGTLMEDALFCVPRQSMRGNVSTQCNIPMMINDGQILKDLEPNRSSICIFERHNLTNPETGEHWKLTTHQPRHFLNTLADFKHVSGELIAHWSGRKSIGQNDFYTHVPQEVHIEAYVALGVDAPKKIAVDGPIKEKASERIIKESISYEEAIALEFGSIISTKYGICRHNYSLTPCPKDKDCVNCGEHTFTKGDKRQINEARNQLSIHTNAVNKCLKALEQGEPGVQKWLDIHKTKQTRWQLALDKLQSSELEDGTLFTLDPPSRTQTKAGLSASIREKELDEKLLGGMF